MYAALIVRHDNGIIIISLVDSANSAAIGSILNDYDIMLISATDLAIFESGDAPYVTVTAWGIRAYKCSA